MQGIKKSRPDSALLNMDNLEIIFLFLHNEGNCYLTVLAAVGPTLPPVLHVLAPLGISYSASVQ